MKGLVLVLQILALTLQILSVKDKNYTLANLALALLWTSEVLL